MQLLQKRACEWTQLEMKKFFSFQALTNILPTVKCPPGGCLASNARLCGAELESNTRGPPPPKGREMPTVGIDWYITQVKDDYTLTSSPIHNSLGGLGDDYTLTSSPIHNSSGGLGDDYTLTSSPIHNSSGGLGDDYTLTSSPIHNSLGGLGDDYTLTSSPIHNSSGGLGDDYTLTSSPIHNSSGGLGDDYTLTSSPIHNSSGGLGDDYTLTSSPIHNSLGGLGECTFWTWQYLDTSTHLTTAHPLVPLSALARAVPGGTALGVVRVTVADARTAHSIPSRLALRAAPLALVAWGAVTTACHSITRGAVVTPTALHTSEPKGALCARLRARGAREARQTRARAIHVVTRRAVLALAHRLAARAVRALAARVLAPYAGVATRARARAVHVIARRGPVPHAVARAVAKDTIVRLWALVLATVAMKTNAACARAIGGAAVGAILTRAVVSTISAVRSPGTLLQTAVEGKGGVINEVPRYPIGL